MARDRTVFLLLLLSAAATTAAAGATSPSDLVSRCLVLLANATACEQDLHARTPPDRYTCGHLSALLRCSEPAAAAGCHGVSAAESAARDKLAAAALFPDADCPDELDVEEDVQRRILRSQRCEQREHLKLNIAVDGCLGFMLAANPGLARSDRRLCAAVRRFRKKCLDRLMPRCFDRGGARYATQELAQVSHLLATVAAEREDLAARIDPSACSYFRRNFGLARGRGEVLEIRGWDLTPEIDDNDEDWSDEEGAQQQQHFEQSWEPLYETILSGQFAPPPPSDLSPEDIMRFVTGEEDGDGDDDVA